MPLTIQREDGRFASASGCPALDCGSLVIEYRAAAIFQLGHPYDWEFAHPGYGTKRGDGFLAWASRTNE